MATKDFTYSFESSKTPHAIFELLLQVPQWWSGFYEETIKGKSEKVDDEFCFKAGGGVHYTEQKLIELVPDKKIVWEVTNSNLNFLKDTGEWTGTKLCFEIDAQANDKTHVTFIHEGLVPAVECYNECSSAWGQYMEQLKAKLN